MPIPLAAILDRLELSGHQFLATFQGVSDEAWRHRPTAGGWSMEEVAEHVAIIEAQVRKLILGPMTESPAPAELLDATAGKEELIDRQMADPGKRTAPETTQPAGRWATPTELGQSFRDNRQRVVDFMRASALDADQYGWDHPRFGPLTLRQWLWFQCRHVERHSAQMVAARGPQA